MADITRALTKVLDATQPKKLRLETLLTLQTTLQHRDLLGDVFNAVQSTWDRLTELFSHETDADILKSFSDFLSTVGTMAVQYGRFSGSRINPYVYLSWIQQQFCRHPMSLNHQKLILEGLCSCLSNLEPTAYKCLAAPLLSACRLMLSRAETPISLFGSILNVMQLLCRVPMAIRDQFVEVVDLVLGWGSCPEASTKTMTIIRSLFNQLRPSWQEHLPHGCKLILSITKNICNLLDTKFASPESPTVFANTLSCLIAIFEACSPFLQPAMFTQSFAHVGCMIQAVSLCPSTGASMSPTQLTDRMTELLKISAIVLIDQEVPNGTKRIWDILNEALHDVQHRPETAACVAAMHWHFLKTVMDSPQKFVVLDNCVVIYGRGSELYALRSSSYVQLASWIVNVYKLLLNEADSIVRRYLGNLLLEDIKKGEIVNDLGLNRLASSGGRTTIEESGAAARRHQSYSRTSILKQRLFALTLFCRSFDETNSNNALGMRIWNAVSDVISEDVDPLVMLHSVKLMQKIWMSSLPKTSVYETLAAIMQHASVKKQEPTLLLLLQWMKAALEDKRTTAALLPKNEDQLLELFSDSETVQVKRAAMAVVHEAIRSQQPLVKLHPFLQRLFDVTASRDQVSASAAIEALKDCSSYCLNPVLCHHPEAADRQLSTVISPGSISFSRSQIHALLFHLTSGCLTTKSDDVQWIVQLLERVAPAQSSKTLSRAYECGDATSISEIGHMLVHKAAKFLMESHAHSSDFGPGMVIQSIARKLIEMRGDLMKCHPINRLHVWLLLEFLFGIRKQISCSRASTPSYKADTLIDEAAIKNTLDKCNLDLLFIARRCKLDRHAAELGCRFLKKGCNEAKIHLMEFQKAVVPKQSVLKVRKKPAEDALDAMITLLRQLFESIRLTCCSLVRLKAAGRLMGLMEEMQLTINAIIQTTMHEDASGWIHWIEACALEADEKYERAIEGYFRHWEVISEHHQRMTEANSREKETLCSILKDLMSFLRERQSVCLEHLLHWSPTVQLVDEELHASETMTRLEVECLHVQKLYDDDQVDAVISKMQSWTGDFWESTAADPMTAYGIGTVEACLMNTTTENSMVSKMFSCRPLLLSVDLPEEKSHFLKCCHLHQCANHLNVDVLLKPMRCVSGDENGDVFSMSSLLYPDQSAMAADWWKETEWLRNMYRLSQRATDACLCPLMTLISIKGAIGRGDFNQARYLLKRISKSNETMPRWMQLATEAESCRMAFAVAQNETEVSCMIQGTWNALCAELQSLDQSNSDKETVVVMSEWLDVFAEGLEFYESSNMVTEALKTIKMPSLTHLRNAADHQSSEDTRYNLPPGTLQPIVQDTRSFSIAQALELNPRRSSAWKKFSRLLMSKIEDHANEDVIQLAVQSLCNCLQSSNEVDFEALIDIVYLMKHQGATFNNNMQKDIQDIPPVIWKMVTGQLIPLLGYADRPIRRSVSQILKAVFEVAPANVLYSVLEKQKMLCTSQERCIEVHDLVQFLQDRHPEMLQQAMFFMNALSRLNALLSEYWLSSLSEAHVECHIRLRILGEELKRMKNHSNSEERASKARDSYDTILQPLARSLKQQFSQKQEQFHQTPFERDFWRKHETKMEHLFASLEAPLDETDLQSVQKRWLGIKGLLKDITETARPPLPPLDKIAPELADMQHTQLPIPGVENERVDLVQVGPKVEILSTKTRPKKLAFIGSDGRSYKFLLKGKEDLHMDAHLLECIGVMNNFLMHAQLPTMRTYSVTPLEEQMGLIQWVDRTASFFTIFRHWQNQQKTKAREQTHTELESTSMAMQHPKEMFHSALVAALHEAGTPHLTQRHALSNEVLLKVFHQLQEAAPQDLLLNEIWEIASSDGDAFEKTRTFARSVAVSSVICYLLGIGDRHLDNVLFDLKTAEVVNIDFNLCFGYGEKLKIPELVPFRLTSIIKNAMGFGGWPGEFRECFAKTLGCLRNHARSLKMLLRSQLDDPETDWTAERTKREFHQNLEFSLRLQLHLNKLNVDSLQTHHSFLEGIQSISENLAQAILQLQTLTERNRVLQEEIQKIDKTMQQLHKGEIDVSTTMHRLEASHQSHQLEMHQMQETLQHMHDVSHSWCYRHGQLLLALLEQGEELLLPSEETWKSSLSSLPMDFIDPQSQTTILSTVLGDHSMTSFLPASSIDECLAVDHRRRELDVMRETNFEKMLDAMTTYGMMVGQLFGIDYIRSSHHFNWIRTIETVLSATMTVMNAPRVPTVDEVGRYHQALSLAYSAVQAKTQSAINAAVISKMQAEQEARDQLLQIQQSFVHWTEKTFESVFLRLLNGTLENLKQEKKIAVSEWACLISGCIQTFRAFEELAASKGILENLGHEMEGLTSGIVWLEAIEGFVSEVTDIVEHIKNGPLMDIEALIQSEWTERTQEMMQQFSDHYKNLLELWERAWSIHSHYSNPRCPSEKLNASIPPFLESRISIEAFASSSVHHPFTLESHVTEPMEAIHQDPNPDVGWVPEMIQGSDMQRDLDQVMTEMETICQCFVRDLCGLTKEHLRFETEDDVLELDLSSREWGQLSFPMLHAFFKVFEKYENITSEFLPLFEPSGQSDGTLRFPPSLSKLDCWLDNMELVTRLMQWACRCMTSSSVDGIDAIALVDAHYMNKLETRIKSPLVQKLQEMTLSLQRIQVKDNHQDVECHIEEQCNAAWQCMIARGNMKVTSWHHQSLLSWMDTVQSDQETRLHHLAALEWTHASLLQSCNLDFDVHLRMYIKDSALFEHNGRLTCEELMDQIKDAVEKLEEIKAPMGALEETGAAVEQRLQQCLVSSVQSRSDIIQSSSLIETMHVLLEGRRNWRGGATCHVDGIMNIAQMLLHFEYSRQGRTRLSGNNPEADVFLDFGRWTDRYNDIVQNVQTSDRLLSEHRQSRSLMISEIARHQSNTHQHTIEMTNNLAAQSDAMRSLVAAGKRLMSNAEALDDGLHSCRSYLENELHVWLHDLREIEMKDVNQNGLMTIVKDIRTTSDAMVEELQMQRTVFADVQSALEQLLLKAENQIQDTTADMEDNAQALFDHIDIAKPLAEASKDTTMTMKKLITFIDSIQRLFEDRETRGGIPDHTLIGATDQDGKVVVSQGSLEKMDPIGNGNHTDIVVSVKEEANQQGTKKGKDWFHGTIDQYPKVDDHRIVDRGRSDYAQSVINNFTKKLNGVTPEGETISIDQQTDTLIAQATSEFHLSRMYEGWMPWI